MNSLNKKILILSILAQVGVVGCNQEYGIKLEPKAVGTAPVIPAGTNSNNNPGVNLTTTTEAFDLARSEIKKIDFFIVVDNSGSMADKQTKLANGFRNFANTFYRRADLDICTRIITSDRYLGRTGANSYQRERSIDCTKPQGSEAWTSAQMQAHIDALIADFVVKINVGTAGSGKELLMKSLVTSLYDLDAYPASGAVSELAKNSFFRPGAFANISFVTDENNWFQPDALTEEINDLPPTIYAVYDMVNNLQDTRKGAKEYLDSFFGILNPNQQLSYSVTTLLELALTYSPVANAINPAQNLLPFSDLIGRGSSKGNLELSDVAYTEAYSSVGQNILQRAYQFSLRSSVYTPSAQTIRVTWVKASGQRVALSYGSQFSMISATGLSVSQSIVDAAVVGDKVEITYQHQ